MKLNLTAHLSPAARLCVAALAVFVTLFAHAPVSAQQWQALLGGAMNRVEWSAEGTQPLANGGYLVTGTTWTGSGDVYVAKLNDDGTRAWSFRYDWGGDETAVCGREVAGGFLICGYAGRDSDPALASNAFLLKLDNNGAFVWMRAYGIPNAAEHAYCFYEATRAAGGGTAVGDFVVVGYSTSANGDLGYAFRTSNTGVVRWGKTYRLPDSLENCRFHSVDEVTVGDDAGRVIVAGYVTRPDRNCLELVLNGGTGAIVNQTHFGLGGDDQLNSVREMKVGAEAGRIVATGSFTVQEKRIYCVKTPANLGAILAERIYFDNINTSGSGWGVKELQQTRAGNVVMAGDVRNHDGMGSTDVFLLEVAPGNLTIAAPGTGFRVYGGTSGDGGITLSEVIGAGVRSAGVVISGNSTSPELLPIGDPQQIYIIKTNAAGRSSCNEDRLCAESAVPGSFRYDPELSVYDRPNSDTVRCTRRIALLGHTRLCYIAAPPPAMPMGIFVSDTTFIDTIECDTTFIDTIPQDTIPRDTLPKDTIITPKDTLRFGTMMMRGVDPRLPLDVAATPVSSRREDALLPAQRRAPYTNAETLRARSRAVKGDPRGHKPRPDTR